MASCSKSLRNQGRDYETGGWFDHVRLGFNYRWTDIAGGDRDRPAREARPDPGAARRAAAARYAELLAGVDGVTTPAADDADHVRSWFVYVVQLDRRDRPRARDRRGSRDAGVRARPSTCPASTSSRTCASASASAEGMCPVAEDASAAASRSRSTRRSRPRTRSAWSRPSAQPWAPDTCITAPGTVILNSAWHCQET